MYCQTRGKRKYTKDTWKQQFAFIFEPTTAAPRLSLCAVFLDFLLQNVEQNSSPLITSWREMRFAKVSWWPDYSYGMRSTYPAAFLLFFFGIFGVGLQSYLADLISYHVHTCLVTMATKLMFVRMLRSNF